MNVFSRLIFAGMAQIAFITNIAPLAARKIL